MELNKVEFPSFAALSGDTKLKQMDENKSIEQRIKSSGELFFH